MKAKHVVFHPLFAAMTHVGKDTSEKREMKRVWNFGTLRSNELQRQCCFHLGE